MAYGRDAQAEEILKEALAKDPSRTAVHVKLLEIYANRKDTQAFEQTALKLKSLTNGAGPEWEKAAALGRSIDPQNGLYGGAGAAAARRAAPRDGRRAGARLRPGRRGGAGRGTRHLARRAVAGAGGQHRQRRLRPGRRTGGARPRRRPTSRPTARSSWARSSPSRRVSGLDFDLGSPKTEAPRRRRRRHRRRPTAAWTSTSSSTTCPARSRAARAAATPDLSSISLDLGSPAEPRRLGGGDPKWQEVATKLDLAKAYEEMGDKDGARELLKEVVKDGDAAQKGQAQAAARQAGLALPSIEPRRASDRGFFFMRIALGLEYDGSRFRGWQTQPGGGAVQDALEPALAEIAGEPVERDLRRPHRPRRARARAGRALRYRRAAPGIGLGARRQRAAARRRRGALVAARWPTSSTRAISALARTYRYVLLNRPVRPALAARPGRLVPPAARRGRDARGRGAARRRARFQRLPLAPSARRSRRCARMHALERRAPRRAHRLRCCAPTPSCTTWCATSSARSSTSARASSRRHGCGEVLRSPRPRAARRRRSTPQGLYLAQVEYEAHWGCRAPAAPSTMPAMRTRVKICGITRPGDALAAARGRRRRDRPGVLSAEPALLSAERAVEIRDALPPFVHAGRAVRRIPTRRRCAQVIGRVRPAHAAVPRRGDAAVLRAVRPALHEGRAGEAGGRFVRIRASIFRAPRRCCSTLTSRRTAAPASASTGR